VTTAKKLLTVLNKITEVPVIQEYIEGEDLELTILCTQGEPVAGSTYLSLRNVPLPYGPPVACLSIKDDTLMNIGKEFLKKLRVPCVAHLDMRRDRKDGQPKNDDCLLNHKHLSSLRFYYLNLK
jgi:predicted ATP-grasp superfamily ATP-dependent carboligase